MQIRNKNIPALVTETLRRHGITGEPVDLMRLARAEGVKVIKNSDVGKLLPNEYGNALCADGRWFIVYDDTRTLEQKRYTVAHELGHILLRHSEEHARHTRRIERQADIFARHLLNHKEEPHEQANTHSDH